MHVGIDEAGHDERARGVDRLRSVRQVRAGARADRDDSVAGDDYHGVGQRCAAVAVDDRCADDGDVPTAGRAMPAANAMRAAAARPVMRMAGMLLTARVPARQKFPLTTAERIERRARRVRK